MMGMSCDIIAVLCKLLEMQVDGWTMNGGPQQNSSDAENKNGKL